MTLVRRERRKDGKRKEGTHRHIQTVTDRLNRSTTDAQNMLCHISDKIFEMSVKIVQDS